MMGYYGWGGHWGWPVAPILWWGLVAVAIVILVKAIKESKGPINNREGESPLEVAKMRYAKGEIDRKQFEELKKDLKD